MKNIVIITQYFPPEIGGGSQRTVGFAEELKKLGADVTVIAPYPTYLMSKNNIKTKFKLFEYSEEGGIKIFRSFVYASDRGRFLTRICYYLSFTFSSLLVALRKIKKTDYVICISPPLFNGISGVLLKKLKGWKLITDIGDLWPESVIQLGYLSNKYAIKFALGLEKWIYKNSDSINFVTRKTLTFIKRNFPNLKSLNYVPNFVNIDKVQKSKKDYALIKKLNLENKMIFGYAGNIGSAQGIKIITDAAKLLISKTEITFLLIGDGVDKEIIENEIDKSKLHNVILLPPVTRDEIIRYISLFDVMVIPLVNNSLFRMTIPSKLYEAMSAQIPVLISVDGEAREIVEKNNCGLFVEPENGDMLAQKVLELINDNNLILTLGRNGLLAAQNEFARNEVIKKFYKILK